MNNNFNSLLETNLDDLNTKEPTYTASLGPVNLRQWKGFTILNIGDNAQGMTQVAVIQANQIAGLFNAMFKVIDHPELFRILEVGGHYYSFGERDFMERAGYVSVINKNDFGAETKVWLTQIWDGTSYSTGHAVIAQPYAVAKEWKTDGAKDANLKNQRTIDLHNGIDLVLRMLKGEISIKFDLSRFGDQRYNVIAGKILLFAQTKEARDLANEDARARGDIAREITKMERFIGANAEAGVEVGLTEVAKAMTVAVMLAEGEKSEMTVVELVGHTVKMVRAGGFPTQVVRSINTQEVAAALISDLNARYGVGSYFEIVA